MGVRDVVRRWAGMLSDEPGQEGREERKAAETPPSQSRRRVRAAGDRSILWTEDPETCERCGRRLLTGELPSLMQRDDDVLLVCPVCMMDMAAAGYRTPQPPAPPEEPRRLHAA